MDTETLRADRSASYAATGAAELTIAQNVAGKAVRDATFLSAFPASELPKVMLASALLSFGGVFVMAGGMTKLGPLRFVPALFVLSAAAFVAEWVLLLPFPAATAIAVYLHVAVLGSLLTSGFWSVVSERFDPHTAKRVIGRVAAGATVGGLLGGLVAERAAAMFDARAMLIALAALSALGAWGVARIGSPERPASAPVEAPRAGLKILRETPYLLVLSALVLLTAVTAGVLDYAFKAEAAAAFDQRERLLSFFAIFYAATGVATVLLQVFSRPVLARLGIGGTLALLPAAVVAAGALGAAVARLWTMVLLRGVEAVLYNSFYRSGYELAFTPVAPEKKRPTKAWVDVGFDRLGGAVAGGLVMIVLVVPADARLVAVLLTVATALGSLLLSLRLHRGYVEELARSLRNGTLSLSESEAIDATTRRTLAETTMAIDREKLLREIEQLRRAQLAEEGTAEPPPASAVPSAPPSAAEPAIVAAVRDLCSGEEERVRRALRPPLPATLVAHALPLLAGTHARAVRRALRQAAPRVVGQLCDALLDRDQPAAVRRRLPEVIEACRDERAVAGLVLGLGERPLEVRQRCALALRSLCDARPALAPSRERVLAAVREETTREDGDLDQAFAVLGLALDAEALRLAHAALRSDDRTLRGTSLEYLENVLPDELRASLWPKLERLAGGAAPRKRDRSRQQIVDELKRSAEGLVLDRRAIVTPDPED